MTSKREVSAAVYRTTPSGFQSNTITFNHDLEPKAEHGLVRLAKWDEHTGSVYVTIAHEDVPAYAAALLAEYVKVEAALAEREKEVS